MYKFLKVSSKDSDDLTTDFHRNIGAREEKITIKKKIRGNYQVRFAFSKIFGFAEHQTSAIYGSE